MIVIADGFFLSQECDDVPSIYVFFFKYTIDDLVVLSLRRRKPRVLRRQLATILTFLFEKVQ